MANELALHAEWTFFREATPPAEVLEALVPGERVEAAYKTVRDVAVFTNMRLIVRDSQGITGKKVEQYSLPWAAVNMWSSENAGHLDLDSEIELWTRAGHVKIELKRGADVRRIDNLIAAHVLGSAPAPFAPVAPQQPVAQQRPVQQVQDQGPKGGMLGGMNPFKRG